MPTVSLQAHFDGKQIQLDEPYNLPANRRLIVTVLPDDYGLAQERDEWFRMAAANFDRGFGPDEPDYSDLVRKS